MSRLRPRARLTVDGQALSAAEAGLAWLRVELGTGAAHDVASAAVSYLSPLADAAPGAALEVELGYDDDLETVLTGTLVGIERHESLVLLEGLAATLPLSHTRIAQSYLKQSASDIVSDFLGQAGVDQGEIAAPLNLAAYHVDERRPLWHHLAALARLSACEITTTPEGGVNFRPHKTGPTSDHSLRYGADLLHWALAEADAPAAPFAVAPFGAGSEAGAEKWHLTLKTPAGATPSEPTLIPAALRDREGAQALQDGLAAAQDRTAIQGSLVAVGSAPLRAGDLLEIADLPNGGPDLVRITEVRHLLDGHAGFRTAITAGAVA